MNDIARVRKMLQQYPFDAKGHCRIDYKDPLTGKVLERVEGDNHVFIDQFMAADFQATALQSSLLVTNGQKELDTDLPYLPGEPIGYGYPGSAATSIYQGSYRSADSFYNSVGQSQVTNMYIYDFLSTQIPDTIRYVGLTGAARRGHAATPFRYRWPRDDYSGIYDIERKRLLFGGTCSLSSAAGGSGFLYIYSIENTPGAVPTTHNVFNVCEKPDNYWTTLKYIGSDGKEYDQGRLTQGYNATWGYDYENQYIVVKITKYCFDRYYDRDYADNGTDYTYRYFYTLRFRDDIFVLSADGTELIKNFSYSWDEMEAVKDTDPTYRGTSWQYYYHFWVGDRFPTYMRLHGDELIALSRTPEDYNSTVYDYVWYTYHYDITSGSMYNDKHTERTSIYLTGYTSILYCYKGYMWGNGQYYSSVTSYGMSSERMGSIPMYDVYNGDVYTHCPVIEETSSYNCSFINKGLTNIYGKTWCVKPRFGDNNGGVSTGSMPFAYTAYQLPADAPERPKNSAVTIAYGLTITW